MIAYLGMLPWTVVYVYIGTTLKNIAEISKSGTWSTNSYTMSMMILATVLSCIGITYLSKKAKKEIDIALNKHKEQ